ncbi:MAG: hypothetical protein LBC44_01880 [Mycoplasmataceae bacterium]|jgi:DNA polymerase III delta subunit|nr:hypothetical protein [Mycoplasmataceae bacterium]
MKKIFYADDVDILKFKLITEFENNPDTYEFYDLQELSLQDVFALLEQDSFLFSKITVIKNAELFFDKKNKNLPALKNISKDLILFCKFKTLPKEIEEVFEIEELKKLTKKNKTDIVKKYVAEYRVNFTPEVIEELIGLDITNPFGFNNELKKVFNYGKNITVSDIYQLVNIPDENNIFKMVELFLDNKLGELIKLYDFLVSTNSFQPIEIMQIFATQVFSCKIICLALENGNNSSTIATKLGIASFIANKKVSLARKTSVKHINQVLKTMLEMDYNIKYKGIKPDIAIKTFFITNGK